MGGDLGARALSWDVARHRSITAESEDNLVGLLMSKLKDPRPSTHGCWQNQMEGALVP